MGQIFNLLLLLLLLLGKLRFILSGNIHMLLIRTLRISLCPFYIVRILQWILIKLFCQHFQSLGVSTTGAILKHSTLTIEQFHFEFHIMNLLIYFLLNYSPLGTDLRPLLFILLRHIQMQRRHNILPKFS